MVTIVKQLTSSINVFLNKSILVVSFLQIIDHLRQLLRITHGAGSARGAGAEELEDHPVEAGADASHLSHPQGTQPIGGRVFLQLANQELQGGICQR